MGSSSMKLCIFLSSLLFNANGFVLVPPTSVTVLPSSTQSTPSKNNKNDVEIIRLFMARGGRPGKSGRGAGQSNNNKKKKGKGPNQKNKKGSSSSGQKSNTSNTSPTSSGSSSRAALMNNKKKQSNHAPPWKIVSKKDMAKNVQAEKQRRKLAQQGIHNHINDENDGDHVEYGISRTFLSSEEKALLAWKRFAISPKDQIDFIGAYLNQQLPPRLGAPEVAFLGRSNVGKSSLLNKLVGSTTARVGKTPGATASVNLYGIFRNDKALLGLVDLPGFGYAKLSKESKEAVQVAAEKYLGKRQELALGIMLVDIRRKPSDDDRAVLAALYDMGVPIVVVATKVDKLSKNQLADALTVIRDGLGLPEGQPLCVSSIDGTGIKDLWKIILEGCENAVEELGRKLQQSGSSTNSRRHDNDHDVPDDAILLEGEGDEFAYNQGYDWIHQSSSVMYEGDEGEYFYDDEEGFSPEEFEEDDHDQFSSSIVAEENLPMRKETIKDLRKRARDMELRGEL